MIGLLTHLSTALNRSEAEAATLLNAFVREVHQAVRTHSEASYPGLGTFRLGPSGALEFRPDASLALVVNHRFAGLTPVPVQPPTLPHEPFEPVWPGAAAATTPAGWMPPTSPLETPPVAVPGDGSPGVPVPGTATAYDPTFASPGAYVATPVAFAPPPETPPVAPYVPPVAPSTAYGDPLGREPYSAPRFAADPAVDAAAYHAPTGYAAPTAGMYTPPPAYTAPTYIAPAPAPVFAEPASAPPPPPENAVVRDGPPRRAVPWGTATLVLLGALALLAWYLWARSPQTGYGTADPATPPASIVTQNDPGFSLPPPDSVPPAAAAVPADSVVPAPTTPAVDPTASAADPAAPVPDTTPAGAAPTPPAARQAAPRTAPPPPSASTRVDPRAEVITSDPDAARPAPSVRRSPSPYTPYTGSSRPDRVVRRSPARRPRTYTGPRGTAARPSRPAPVAAPPAPERQAPPPVYTPPSTEVGLTPELEAMLLGDEAVQPGAGYTIVVKGEATEEAARIVAERYRAVGYRVNVLEGLTAQGTTIFRVVVGQFASLAQVQRALRTLAGEAFPADAWMLPLAQ